MKRKTFLGALVAAIVAPFVSIPAASKSKLSDKKLVTILPVQYRAMDAFQIGVGSRVTFLFRNNPSAIIRGGQIIDEKGNYFFVSEVGILLAKSGSTNPLDQEVFRVETIPYEMTFDFKKDRSLLVMVGNNHYPL